MPRARLFGVALSVFGVLLVGGMVPSGGGSATLLGNALMVVAVLAYGAYAVQGRALRAGGGHTASVATAAGFAAGLLFLLPPAAGEALFFDTPDLGPKGWLALAYPGIVASGLTMFLWNYAPRHVPASAATLYVNLIPVVGLGFSVLVGEAVGAAHLVGGTLAVAGVHLGTPRSGSNVDGTVEPGS